MNVFCPELLLISMRLNYWHGLFLGKNPECILSKCSNCTGSKIAVALVSLDSNGSKSYRKVGLCAALARHHECLWRASFHELNLGKADNAGRGLRAFPLKIHFPFLNVPISVAGRIHGNGLGLQPEQSKLKEARLEEWDPGTNPMTGSWQRKRRPPLAQLVQQAWGEGGGFRLPECLPPRACDLCVSPKPPKVIGSACVVWLLLFEFCTTHVRFCKVCTGETKTIFV